LRLTRAWQIVLCCVIGIALGLGIIAFRIANAVSYLSDEPETCINCHVMTDAYATWRFSSHGRVAVCNDCHVPHSNPLAKAAFKAMDGLKHSYVFTLRNEPQVLHTSDRAVRVLQVNCLDCHSNQLMMVRLAATSERQCWDCHTIHSSVQSLSASPHVLRPQLPTAGLKFMKKGVDRDSDLTSRGE
jgi:cytochrome c nitrite reductase small subunit